MDWSRSCITLLTVAAFGLSAAGLLLVRNSAAAAVQRTRHDREVRNRLLLEMEKVTEVPSQDTQLYRDAVDRWEAAHHELWLTPHTRDSVKRGYEPLAEMIIDELDQGSRVDVILVGLASYAASRRASGAPGSRAPDTVPCQAVRG